MTPKPPKVDPLVIPLKSSLLTKMDIVEQQNPTVYLDGIVEHSDIFNDLFEDIKDLRDRGMLLVYQVGPLGTPSQLKTFVVVQDPRGVLFICPIDLRHSGANQALIALMGDDAHSHPYVDPNYNVGSTTVTEELFTSACSRGFDNASAVLLGHNAIKLKPGHNLIACFQFVPNK